MVDLLKYIRETRDYVRPNREVGPIPTTLKAAQDEVVMRRIEAAQFQARLMRLHEDIEKLSAAILEMRKGITPVVIPRPLKPPPGS